MKSITNVPSREFAKPSAPPHLVEQYYSLRGGRPPKGFQAPQSTEEMTYEDFLQEASAAEALVVAVGVGAARALAALAVAAQRWAPPVARPVKEPSAAAPRAVVVRVVAPRAVEAAAAAVAVAAVFGDPQLEQLAVSWALAAWEGVTTAADAWVAVARAMAVAARARVVAIRAVAKEVGVIAVSHRLPQQSRCLQIQRGGATTLLCPRLSRRPVASSRRLFPPG